jgi:hypothetical protein
VEARGFFILSVLAKGSPAKNRAKSPGLTAVPFVFEFDFPGAPSSVFEGGAFAVAVAFVGCYGSISSPITST